MTFEHHRVAVGLPPYFTWLHLPLQDREHSMAVVEPAIADIRPPVVALRPAVRLLYGIGGIPEAVKTILFSLFTLFFYTTVMGMSGTLVGIATALGLLWDAIIDPYIGHLSDRTRIRFGRRHGFMLVGALTMGLSLWLFFSPPRGLSTPLLFAWLLGSSLLVRTSTSIFNVPYYALGAELSDDYHERSVITGVRGFLGLLGTLAAASLSFLIFFPDRLPGVDPKLDYAGYPALGLAFGLFITVAGLVATFGTLAHRARPATPASATGLSARRDALLAFRNRSFSRFFTSYSLFFMGLVINGVLAVHFYTYYLRITESRVLSQFQLAFALGGLTGVAVWMWVARRIDKKRLYEGCALVTAGIFLAAYLLLGEGRLFGTGNVAVVTLGNALGGFFGSVLWFIPASMLADVADEDELLSGERREGIFFGLYFFGQQAAAGLAILLTGVLLDRFAGLVAGQATQSAATAGRIGLLFGLLPSTLLVAAALLTFRYSLDAGRVRAIQSELAGRRPPSPIRGID